MKKRFITILNGACRLSRLLSFSAVLAFSDFSFATVEKIADVKIADNGLHFDGQDVGYDVPDNGTDKYDFHFGRNISAHGDAVKTYKHYVFMTWYRGGKDDRHMMLSRYNTQTGSVKSIEFPHRHTGFRGDWWIGESHNTIGLAVSPINGTIHMVFDMHAYDDNNYDGKFKDDYFRYTYSLPGAAEVDDDDFTLAQFVEDTSDINQSDASTGYVDYKHLTMTGDLADKSNFARLTYPKFFTTTDGTLLLYMRLGGNNNGAYVFNRYDANSQKWSKFTQFNEKDQKSKGNPYNWGLYGNMKYVNGKLRVGFQQRSSDNDDKYKYQNGVYYAYSDHPEGFGDWRNHKGEAMTWPLVNSDEIKVFEPGDYITHQQPNSVYIVGSFDWTVTARGDIHIISLAKTNNSSAEAEQYGFADVPKENVYIHSYKPAGADEFIHDTDFVGASNIYTAGDNIYIIGLKNSRPFVEKAVGGTSNFERVYEQTSGTVYDHGTVYVKDGKVYYYLMEKASGNAMPLHLQVIDLDIPKVSVDFEQPELTLVKDYSTVSISATPSIQDPARSIKSVALYLNDELVSILNTAPYVWTQSASKLQNLALGSYEIKALVTSDTDVVSESFMTLKVIEGTPEVSFVNSDITLLQDYDSVAVNVEASTPDSNRTITKVSLYIDDQLISADDTAPYQWTQSNTALQNLPVGEYALQAVVEDSEGETAETTTTLLVVNPTPIAAFSQESYKVSEGYTSLSLSVDASTPVVGRTISQVELYVNDNFIRSESVAPYDWGHNDTLASELLNFPVGTHTLKAVVTDSQGLALEVVADLYVEETVVAPEVSFSVNSLSVEEGYGELTVSVNASTPMTSRTLKQVALFVNDTEVSVLTEAPYRWTQAAAELSSLAVGTHELKAIATDSQDLQSETSMQVVVTAKTPEPQPDPKPVKPESSGGGGSLGFLWLLGLAVVGYLRVSRFKQQSIKG